jgi:hypothetical protein
MCFVADYRHPRTNKKEMERPSEMKHIESSRMFELAQMFAIVDEPE